MKLITTTLILLLLGSTSYAQNESAQAAQILKVIHNDNVRNFNLYNEQVQRNYELKMQAQPRQQPNWQTNPYTGYIQQQNR